MDTRALSFAREGCYPQAIEADVSEERLRRFFTRDGDQYRVKRDLRDSVLFANHSLLRDPPFSRLDLISCRNLLIYLDRDLQQQVLARLHYGLTSTGYIFLGSSEAAEHPDNLFYAVDRDARLFQSTGRMPDKFPNLPWFAPSAITIDPTPSTPLSGRATQSAHREALEAAAPPSILVDDMLHALHLSENAGRYLMPSGDEAIGRTKWELLKTVVQGAKFHALRQALLKDGTWRGELHEVSKDGRQLTVESHIALVEAGGKRYVLESTRDITESQ